MSDTTVAEGWPKRDEMDVLLALRQAVIDKGKALGLKFIGCGSGVGGADVGFKLGDKRIEIDINIGD